MARTALHMGIALLALSVTGLLVLLAWLLISLRQPWRDIAGCDSGSTHRDAENTPLQEHRTSGPAPPAQSSYGSLGRVLEGDIEQADGWVFDAITASSGQASYKNKDGYSTRKLRKIGDTSTLPPEPSSQKCSHISYKARRGKSERRKLGNHSRSFLSQVWRHTPILSEGMPVGSEAEAKDLLELPVERTVIKGHDSSYLHRAQSPSRQSSTQVSSTPTQRPNSRSTQDVTTPGYSAAPLDVIQKPVCVPVEGVQDGISWNDPFSHSPQYKSFSSEHASPIPGVLDYPPNMFANTLHEPGSPRGISHGGLEELIEIYGRMNDSVSEASQGDEITPLETAIDSSYAGNSKGVLRVWDSPSRSPALTPREPSAKVPKAENVFTTAIPDEETYEPQSQAFLLNEEDVRRLSFESLRSSKSHTNNPSPWCALQIWYRDPQQKHPHPKLSRLPDIRPYSVSERSSSAGHSPFQPGNVFPQPPPCTSSTGKDNYPVAALSSRPIPGRPFVQSPPLLQPNLLLPEAQVIEHAKNDLTAVGSAFWDCGESELRSSSLELSEEQEPAVDFQALGRLELFLNADAVVTEYMVPSRDSAVQSPTQPHRGSYIQLSDLSQVREIREGKGQRVRRHKQITGSRSSIDTVSRHSNASRSGSNRECEIGSVDERGGSTTPTPYLVQSYTPAHESQQNEGEHEKVEDPLSADSRSPISLYNAQHEGFEAIKDADKPATPFDASSIPEQRKTTGFTFPSAMAPSPMLADWIDLYASTYLAHQVCGVDMSSLRTLDISNAGLSQTSPFDVPIDTSQGLMISTLTSTPCNLGMMAKNSLDMTQQLATRSNFTQQCDAASAISATAGIGSPAREWLEVVGLSSHEYGRKPAELGHHDPEEDRERRYPIFQGCTTPPSIDPSAAEYGPNPVIFAHLKDDNITECSISPTPDHSSITSLTSSSQEGTRRHDSYRHNSTWPRVVDPWAAEPDQQQVAQALKDCIMTNCMASPTPAHDLIIAAQMPNGIVAAAINEIRMKNHAVASARLGIGNESLVGNVICKRISINSDDEHTSRLPEIASSQESALTLESVSESHSSTPMSGVPSLSESLHITETASLSDSTNAIRCYDTTETDSFPEQRTCSNCPGIFLSETTFSEHIKRRRCRRHTCGSCTARFALTADLNRHLRTVHRVIQKESKIFICSNPWCSVPGKQFLRKDNFERHYRLCVKEAALA